MSTREKVKEGIGIILFDNSIKGYKKQKNFTELAEDIMRMESDLGVVLKVDRELSFDCINCVDCHYHHCYPSPEPKNCTCELDVAVSVFTLGIPKDCPLRASYVATEPLI